MSRRDIGTEILDGIKEVKASKAGKLKLKTRQLRELPPTQAIRKRLRLSQFAFASLMGVSVRTVQDWKQGRRMPSGPARSLLRIAEKHPEVFTNKAEPLR